MSERDGSGMRSRSADAGVGEFDMTKITFRLFWAEMRSSPRVQFSSRPWIAWIAKQTARLPGCPSAAGRGGVGAQCQAGRARSRGHLI